ncbi:phage tail tape measure protein [Mycobacterium hackensackense]|uniref:phage tail tape measure protein n=1 Tax=Mycobacterium hackensackense TaxID=228909 RepID=UPI002265A104|nr:phage tail tape measure protein [Mycobacterium hackensackense]MCV7255693.1 phage tail tape measure protein [Mycobacterium hackensackense]
MVGAVAAIGAGALLEAGEKAAGLVLKGFESIIDTGLDFSKTMNNFQGVTRAAPADMAKMQKAARDLGADTTLAGASASGAATAMTELAKAGFSVDQAIGAARGTMQLATAGQIESAQAAEIQANAMNAFGLNADSAAHTADVLANAAIASSADIPDLAQALAQVGGVAKGFGENLDDTVAALAMFANAGVKGSDAGTLLKTTMQSITDQGNPAQGAIQSLGLELYKLNQQGDKQFVGFRDLFRQLDEAKKRMTSEDFQADTNILFGSDAMRSAMLGNAQAFDDMYTKLQRVGAAGEMANAQMQGLPGAVESFKNTTESIKLDAFDALGPALTGGLNEFVTFLTTHKAEVVQFFVTMGDAALRMGQVIAGSVARAAGILGTLAGAVGLDDMAKSLKFVEESSDQAVNSMGKARLGLELYGKRTAEAKKFTDGLGDSVKTLAANGKDVTIDVKDNTPEVQQKLAAMGYRLMAIAGDPTHLTIIPNTEEAGNQLEAWRAEQSGQTINPNVHPELGPADDAMSAWIAKWKTAISAPVNVLAPNQAPSPTTRDQLLLPVPPRARGGIDGIGRDAHIGSPVYPNGLVRYREPSTGGEAYIPLNGSQRSLDIWQETGSRLGVHGVMAFDQGGFSPDVVAAEALAGTGYSQGNRTDCSGMAARVINRALGLPDSGLMSTKNAAQWLAERGFQPGMGGPGAITVGWYDHGPNPNDGHMAMTLSNGMGAEAGGKNGEFTVGSGAAKASDPQFDQHMFLPVQGMYGEGRGSDGGVGGYGMGGGSIPAGSVAGVDPTTGESGYYTQDPRKMREADQRVADADKRVARAEQRQSELKATAKESQKQAAQDELDEAKREAADARADRDDAAKGKFTKLKSGKGVNGQGNATDPIGGIVGSFFKETLGLDGSMFPDISQLGVVQLLNAIAGIKYTPQGKGFPWQTGYANGDGTPWSGSPFAPAGAPGEAAATSGLPFGMIPSAIDAAGYARAGMAPPGTPASGIGSGPAPGPVDMSRNVSIQVDSGPTSGEIGDVVRKQVANVDRLHTYVPKGA